MNCLIKKMPRIAARHERELANGDGCLQGGVIMVEITPLSIYQKVISRISIFLFVVTY